MDSLPQDQPLHLKASSNVSLQEKIITLIAEAIRSGELSIDIARYHDLSTRASKFSVVIPAHRIHIASMTDEFMDRMQMTEGVLGQFVTNTAHEIRSRGLLQKAEKPLYEQMLAEIGLDLVLK